MCVGGIVEVLIAIDRNHFDVKAITFSVMVVDRHCAWARTQLGRTWTRCGRFYYVLNGLSDVLWGVEHLVDDVVIALGLAQNEDGEQEGLRFLTGSYKKGAAREDDKDAARTKGGREEQRTHLGDEGRETPVPHGLEANSLGREHFGGVDPGSRPY